MLITHLSCAKYEFQIVCEKIRREKAYHIRVLWFKVHETVIIVIISTISLLRNWKQICEFSCLLKKILLIILIVENWCIIIFEFLDVDQRKLKHQIRFCCFYMRILELSFNSALMNLWERLLFSTNEKLTFITIFHVVI
jgi:hypothetical protein